MIGKQKLQTLFAPTAIAVVGASATRGKLGYAVLRNIKTNGFRGKIYPINPKHKEIAWLTAYKSVVEVPGKIDVAVILVPAKFVPKVIHECGQKRIPYVVVISAGFKEVGKEGLARELELQKLCAKYHIRLIGPNCLGYINTAHSLNASFASGMPTNGNVGLVSQSGAMGVAMLDWAYESQLGFSKIVSIGNKADIDEVEILEYFGRDRQTKVIMMYLESIEDGRKLMTTAAQITPQKPIVMLKAGSSKKAQQAVLSHTGSLTGSEEAARAAFVKAGIIYTKTMEEFFDIGLALSQQPLPKNNRVAIVTNAGGPGIMAVDAARRTEVELPTLNAALQKKLRQKLPDAASTSNPVDVIGDALSDRYHHALSTLLASRFIDGVIAILTPQVMTDEDTTAKIIGQLQKKYQKPVLASFIGGKVVHSGRVLLETYGIPQYDTPERAVRAMDQLIRYARWQSEKRQKVRKNIMPAYRAPKSTRRLPFVGHHVQIRTQEAEKILQDYKLPVVSSILLQKIEDCDQIKDFPVVMKVASRSVVHKSVAHAVALNIQNVAAAKRAWHRIYRGVRRAHPRAEVEGILVQRQAEPGQEVIIGMKRDLSFGPVVMFGLGGTIVEVFHDVSFGIAPLTIDEAIAMTAQIKTKALLARSDIRPAVQALVAVSKLSLAYPEIAELDINPLILYPSGQGGAIVDVRMMTISAH